MSRYGRAQQKPAGQMWGQCSTFASLAAPVSKAITLERRDAWQTTSAQTAVYVLPPKDGITRILITHLSASGDARSAGWAIRINFICPCHGGVWAADGKLIAGPPPRSMDSDLEVENGVLKVRYQYFRQLISHKEVMA